MAPGRRASTAWQYIPVKVNITENQKEKIKKAAESDEGVSIRLNYDDLSGEHILGFTQKQVDKMKEAIENQKGISIKMSKTQVKYNKGMEGGFIGALLASAASAVVPSAVKWIWDKLRGTSSSASASSGKGLYIKRGSGIIKVQHIGDGLFLKPYATDKITGQGLSIKKGASFEELEGVSDAKLLDALLKNY